MPLVGEAAAHHGWVRQETPLAAGLGGISCELGLCLSVEEKAVPRLPSLSLTLRRGPGAPFAEDGQSRGLSGRADFVLGVSGWAISLHVLGRGFLIWGFSVGPWVLVLF